MRRHLLSIGLMLLFLSGCTAPWLLPDGYVLECARCSDCPGEQSCNEDAHACVNSDQSVCGNGFLETGEECDLGGNASLEENCVYGQQSCGVCLAAIGRYGEKVGAWCGDCIVQHEGVVGAPTLYNYLEPNGLMDSSTDGVDSGEWEACDSGEPVA